MANTRISNITRGRNEQVRPSAQKAQNAARSTEKLSPKDAAFFKKDLNPVNNNTGPEVYRYPREALSNTTDALLITIFDQFRMSDTGSNLFNIDKDLVQYKTGSEGTVKEGKKYVSGVNLEKLGITAATDFFMNNRDKVKKKNVKNIYLPIPQQITDSLAVAYSEDTLNPLQAVGLQATSELIKDPAKFFRSGSDIAKALIDGNVSGLDENTKSTIQSALSGQALNALGANVNANSLISRATGQILQSNLELLFSGVTLRTFPFVFDFTPRDQVEAREVMGIIRCLKASMTPKKGSPSNVFIQSPQVFELQYITGNEHHPFLNKFKLCSLAQLSVNYTASGTYATYPDGTPVHMQVTCAFKEINPIYAEDYDGYAGAGPIGPDSAVGGVGY